MHNVLPGISALLAPRSFGLCRSHARFDYQFDSSRDIESSPFPSIRPALQVSERTSVPLSTQSFAPSQTSGIVLSTQAQVMRLDQQANSLYQSGRWADALDAFQALVVLQEERMDWQGLCEVLNRLGCVALHLNQTTQAYQTLHRSLAIAQWLDFMALQAESLSHLAQVHRHWGNREEALTCIRKVLEVYAKLDSDKEIGRTLDALGMLHGDFYENDRMEHLCYVAADVLRTVGDQEGEAQALYNAGIAANRLNKSDRAIEHLERSLSIYTACGDFQHESLTLTQLGHAYHHMGQLINAMCCYQDAALIDRELGDRPREVLNLIDLAGVYREDDMVFSALDACHQIIEIAEGLKLWKTDVERFVKTARSLEVLGEVDHAMDYYQQAFDVLQHPECGMDLPEH